ncbi:MAG TPA: 6-bladed beta-propeller [Gemmatimonadales bacterium]|nr:6-bladed beta-propeller [Gemmatimonadales bacterium]
MMPRVMQGHTGPVLVLAMLLSACRPPDNGSPASTIWQLDPEPILTLTSDRLPEGHELNGIYSALEMPDGSLLIANSGAHELLLVDSVGQYLRTIGRSGQGPGEYSDNLHLFHDRGDTIVVYDGGNLRWTFLTPSLDLARTVVEYNADVPSPSWLYRGSLVTDATIGQGRGRAREILTRLRLSDPEFEHLLIAKQDAQGAVWVRRLEDAREWEVYQGTDTTYARVTLPPGLDLIASGKEAVMGVTRDTLGEEQVQVHRLDRPPGSIRPAIEAEAEDPAPAAPVERPPLARELVKLVIAQESYYSDHTRYADVTDSLRVRIEGGGRLSILYADQRHWAGVAVMPSTGLTCGMAVGYPTPASWQEGAPVCDK